MVAWLFLEGLGSMWNKPDTVAHNEAQIRTAKILRSLQLTLSEPIILQVIMLVTFKIEIKMLRSC